VFPSFDRANQSGKGEIGMKTLVSNLMSVFLEIILWLNIIVCAIVGYNMVDKNSLLGAILGILVGFVLNVLEGGFYILLMEIRDYTKETAEINYSIKDYLKEIAKKDETATKNEAADTKKVNLDMNSLLRK
jgi:uncharacterized membrane protein YgaE (UPF0421/DUF939 family)